MEGEPGMARAAAAARELWSRRDAYAGSIGLDEEARATVLADLGRRVGAIYEAEVATLDATAAALGRRTPPGR